MPNASLDDLDEVAIAKARKMFKKEHFSVPYILTVDEILAKIHNLTLREMPGGTLFPDTSSMMITLSARHFTTA